MNKTRWLVLPALAIVATAAWWWTQRSGVAAVPAQAAAITLGSPQTTVLAGHMADPVLQISVAGAQANGDGVAALRERLVADLKLNASQQRKLDTILVGWQPRFLALDKLEPMARQAAHAKLVGELQLKINATLTPDQRATYEQMQAQADKQKLARAATNRVVQPDGGSGAEATAAPGAVSTSAKPLP